MKTKTGHTATPWKIDPGYLHNAQDELEVCIESSSGVYIGSTSSDALNQETEANAAFIVKAVNNHHHLERILELWNSGGNIAGAIHNARLDLEEKS